MPAIGRGVDEIRISEPGGARRIIYIARCVEAGNERNGELRKCLGRDRGYPRAGKARAELMQKIAARQQEHDWTQAEAASRCGVTQPRINDLLRGRVSRFSLDALVNIATALGCRVRFDLDAA